MATLRGLTAAQSASCRELYPSLDTAFYAVTSERNQRRARNAAKPQGGEPPVKGKAEVASTPDSPSTKEPPKKRPQAPNAGSQDRAELTKSVTVTAGEDWHFELAKSFDASHRLSRRGSLATTPASS